MESKNIFVNNSDKCYFKGIRGEAMIFEEFCYYHKEADQKIPMHAVYASQMANKVCVVAK